MVIEDKITMHWYEDKSLVSTIEQEAVKKVTTAEP
jgi:hypothetical protein